MRIFNLEESIRRDNEQLPYRWRPLSICGDVTMIDDGGYGPYANQSKFGLEVAVRATFFANQAQYPEALRNAQELVNREFFGDVLKYINYARRAVMECDKAGAMRALDMLEKEMTG